MNAGKRNDGMVYIVNTCILYFVSLLALDAASSSGEAHGLRRCLAKHFGCYYLRSFDKCVCKIKRGCSNSFKYQTLSECVAHNFKKVDPCAGNPCNKGVCVPKRGRNKFTCDCLETGFYGRQCHKKCPMITLYY